MPLALTVDTEWASEADIAAIFALADAHGVPLFPFVTHESAFLRARGGAQGIHPNFIFDGRNTQGTNEAEVMDHCFRLVPNAKAFRSHCFYSHTRLLWAMAERGIVADSNLLSYLQRREPFTNVGGFTTYPVYWCDDVALRGGETRLPKLKLTFTRADLVCVVHPGNWREAIVQDLFKTARLHCVPFESLYA